MAFHSFKDDAVDDVADGDNQDHDGDDGAHVIQVAAHHQDLAEAEAEVKHFSSNERAPGKGPSLLQTGNNEGQAGWQKDVPEQLEALRAEVASGLAEDLRHLLASVFHGEGYR